MRRRSVLAGCVIAGIVLALAVLLLAWVCGRNTVLRDPWYAPADKPENGLAPAQVGTESVEWKEVLAQYRTEACQAVESVPIAAIPSNSATRLVGNLIIPSRGNPYIVRRLACDSMTAGTAVYVKDGYLHVIGGFLGSGTPRVARRPIVVWLTHEPKGVVVDGSGCR